LASKKLSWSAVRLPAGGMAAAAAAADLWVEQWSRWHGTACNHGFVLCVAVSWIPKPPGTGRRTHDWLEQFQ
jgi:hypothetical protein